MDADGKLGEGGARNAGVRLADGADWVFLLDADDLMAPSAFSIPMPDRGVADAAYGCIRLQRMPSYTKQEWATQEPRWGAGKTWDDLMEKGSDRTICIGGFFRRECLIAHPFREDLFPPACGTDWEFHLSFLAGHAYSKTDSPLVLLGTHLPSAGGPRGVPSDFDWNKSAVPFFQFWRKRGRIPLSTDERATRYWE